MAKQNILIRNKKKKAVELFQNKQFEQAKELLTYICKRNKNDHESLFFLGTINAQSGIFVDAESQLSAAIKLQPGFFEAVDSLAAVMHCLGKKNEAIDMFKKSIAIQPNFYSSHYNLGNVLNEMGMHDDALISYQKAITLNPDFAGAYNNIGLIHYTHDRNDSAIENLLKSVKIDPNQPAAFANLSKAYYKQGDLPNAVSACEKSIKLQAGNPEYHYDLARLRQIQGLYPLSVKSYRTAIKLKPDYVEAYNLLGTTYINQGKLDEAIECYQKIETIDSKSPHVPVGYASIDISKGNYSDAYIHLKPLINDNALTVKAAHLLGILTKHTKKFEEAADAMEYVIDNEKFKYVEEFRQLHFGLGGVYDQTSKFDKAFKHYETANQYHPYEFDIKATIEKTNELISIINRDTLNTIPHSDSTAAPIFIIGMNRSGTSLIEQIISSHPDVYGAGELETINEISENLISFTNNPGGFPSSVKLFNKQVIDDAAKHYQQLAKSVSNNAKRITDKMPHNFWHLPIIELLFPNAVIIHSIRNPMDVCLSNYFQDFGGRHPHTNNLQNMGEYYIQYDRLMNHWKNNLNITFLDVTYEELVENQEEVSRKIIDYCGLEWDERCLEFYKSKRIVTTASSDQVNQPIYKKSVERWKNYEQHLTTLTDMFDSNNISY